MSLTLDQMVSDVRGKLNQFGTTRDQKCTFKGWTVDVSGNKVGLSLDDVPGAITNATVELGTEQVYVNSWDASSLLCDCPPWFRGVDGSPLDDAYPVGSVAIINPRWPWWAIAQEIVNGVNAIYPDLYAVKTVTIPFVQWQSKYLLPSDCDDVLQLKIDPYYPTWGVQREIWQFSVDELAADGNKYLHIVPRYLNGQNMYVTYRCAPTAFPGYVPTATWTSTGLPESASDLPILYAVSALIPSADAARTQSSTLVQSDANRYVQTGTAGTIGNHFDQQFQQRLETERVRLANKFNSHTRLTLNG